MNPSPCSVQDPTAPLAGRAARRASRVVVAFFFLLLSLAVMVAPTPAAQAGVIPPINPLVVGESLAAPEEVMGIVEAGGVCLASLVCGVALGGTLLAAGLYQQRDTFLPIIKGIFGDAFEHAGPSPLPPGCGFVVGMTKARLNNSADPAASGGVDYGFTASGTGTCHATAGIFMNESNVVCQNRATKEVQVSSKGVWSNGVGSPNPDNGNTNSWKVGLWSGVQLTVGGSGFAAVCGAGWDLASIDVRMLYSSSGGVWVSAVNHLQQALSSYNQLTTVTCRKPDGTTLTITSNTTDTDKIVVPSCGAASPGSIPSDVTFAAGLPGAEQTVGHLPLGADPRTQYPDCFGADGAYLNTCRVKVWLNGVPCVNGMTGCYDPDTYGQDHPGSNYECKWGSYVVRWTDCAPLRHHYGTTPETQTKTVTDVDTTTGQPKVDPVPGVGTEPGTTTWTDVLPPCFVDVCEPPVPPTEPVVKSPRTPEDQASCMGAVSFNPVSWVLVPIKCALRWAFIPEDAPTFTDIPSPLPPGWLPSLPSLAPAACGAVTMPDINLGFDNVHSGVVTLFDTCDSPWPLVRQFSYNGLFALILGTALWQSFRATTGALGLGVTTGAGGDEEA